MPALRFGCSNSISFLLNPSSATIPRINGIGILSFLIGIVYLIMKLIWWDRFPGGTAPAIICSMFIGGIQLFFLGFLGEYIMSMNARIMNRPLVVEEERINFDENKDKKELSDESKD